MKKVVYLLGIFIYGFLPLIIIIARHLRYDDGSYNLALGSILLLIPVIYFGLYKKLKNRVNVWDLQGVNKPYVITFRCLTGIIAIALIYLIMNNIALKIDELLFTTSAVLLFMIIGWVIQLVSEIVFE